MLLITVATFCTAYVDINEITSDRILNQVAPTIWLPSLQFVSLGLSSLCTRHFPIKYCRQSILCFHFSLEGVSSFLISRASSEKMNFNFHFFIETISAKPPLPVFYLPI